MSSKNVSESTRKKDTASEDTSGAEEQVSDTTRNSLLPLEAVNSLLARQLKNYLVTASSVTPSGKKHDVPSRVTEDIPKFLSEVADLCRAGGLALSELRKKRLSIDRRMQMLRDEAKRITLTEYYSLASQIDLFFMLLHFGFSHNTTEEGLRDPDAVASLVLVREGELKEIKEDHAVGGKELYAQFAELSAPEREAFFKQLIEDKRKTDTGESATDTLPSLSGVDVDTVTELATSVFAAVPAERKRSMPDTVRDASDTTPMVERPDARAIIRILKDQHGMTQRDVADALGRTRSTIGAIASGLSSQPREEIVLALQKLLEKQSQK